jgi:hypothetical protein
MKKKIYGMIGLMIILGLGLAPSASAVNVTLQTNPAGPFSPGSTFTVKVLVDATSYNDGTNTYLLGGGVLGIDYDYAAFTVVAFDTDTNAAGHEGITSELFLQVSDTRTPPGTPTEAEPKIGNNSNGVLYLSGANVGDPANPPVGTLLFGAQFQVKSPLADGNYTMKLVQSQPSTSGTGWTAGQLAPPLVGVKSTWKTDGTDASDDFKDIPYVFGADLSVNIQQDTTDTDGDGLSDSAEGTLGTNPKLADTDGDGYSDKYEVDNGMDPLVADAANPGNPNYDDRYDIRVSNLDVDGNGKAELGKDGVLILRYLFGFRGTTLTNNAVGTACTRCDAAAIEPYIAHIDEITFDIDGNGKTELGKDGVLIMRYMFGFRDSTLTNNAVATDCTRCSAAEIQATIQRLFPD